MTDTPSKEQTAAEANRRGVAEAFDYEMQRLVRKLKLAMQVVSLVMIAFTAVEYYLNALNPWEAFILCTAIPILITSSLLVNYEGSFTNRRIQSEFKKTSLMALGAMITLPGLTLLILSLLGGSLNIIIMDSGVGTTLMCSGFYVVKHFGL